MTATATTPTAASSRPLDPRPLREAFARCYPGRTVGLDAHTMEEHNRRCSPWHPAPWHYERLAADDLSA